MNIVAAHQNLSSSEQLIAHKSRLEVPRGVSTPADNSAQPTPANNSRPTFAPPTVAVPSTESTSSDEQNEDSQQFNALLSVGAVKRILEQLTSGKLLSWIEGSDLEKIYAQTAQQQASTPPVAAPDAPPTNTPTAALATMVALYLNYLIVISKLVRILAVQSSLRTAELLAGPLIYRCNLNNCR